MTIDAHHTQPDHAPADAAFAIDPNCGMPVALPSRRHAGYRSKQYHFCGDGCQRTFEADPEAVLAKARQREIEAGRLDPVCGMTIDPAHPHCSATHDGADVNFCSEGCRDSFVADPVRYLGHANTPAPRQPSTVPASTIYTCPMHPEVRQSSPGACPKCGMALESLLPTAEPDDGSDVRAMAVHFWLLVALTIPVFLLSMGPDLFGWHFSQPWSAVGVGPRPCWQRRW